MIAIESYFSGGPKSYFSAALKSYFYKADLKPCSRWFEFPGSGGGGQKAAGACEAVSRGWFPSPGFDGHHGGFDGDHYNEDGHHGGIDDRCENGGDYTTILTMIINATMIMTTRLHEYSHPIFFGDNYADNDNVCFRQAEEWVIHVT